MWGVIRVKGVPKTGGGTPCGFCLGHRRWRSWGGMIRVRGVPKFAGGRYVNPPAFLWGRRWRSLGGTIRVKGVPTWARGH